MTVLSEINKFAILYSFGREITRQYYEIYEFLKCLRNAFRNDNKKVDKSEGAPSESDRERQFKAARHAFISNAILQVLLLLLPGLLPSEWPMRPN